MSVRRKSLLSFLVVPLVLVLSVVGLAVASAARSGHAGPAASQPATPTITISMFVYHTPASVAKGARIKVINKDSAPHTVTSDTSGKFNVSIPAHATRFFNAPSTAGTYHFHCTVHPNMHGVLHVG
jgi:plastocyanin